MKFFLKTRVQLSFFKKQTKMQLLNSNIPQGAQTTRYSNKKAQDLLNLVLFCCVAFSYYFGGGDAGTCTPVLNASVKPSTYLFAV